MFHPPNPQYQSINGNGGANVIYDNVTIIIYFI